MSLAPHGLVIADHDSLARDFLHDSIEVLQSARRSDPQHTGVGDIVEK